MTEPLVGSRQGTLIRQEPSTVPGPSTGAARRTSWRRVAMPVEHGGWGLTLEPGLLGVLCAPGLASFALALAAVATFLVRTPLRLVLIDRRRDRESRPGASKVRARLAACVALAELVVTGAAIVLTAWLALVPLWWLPALLAGPLLAVALWHDRQGRSRDLLPELAGPFAIASVAPMGALAAGAACPLAIGLWLVLAARISSSIPHVRDQIDRLHGRPATPVPGVVGDVVALLLGAGAVALHPPLIGGAAAVIGLIIIQRLTLARPPRPARVLGIRQMVLGLGLVAATALGVWLGSS
jgi:hypothetical protein